jgi:EmrB/QacA subfamily drug resistance transporter
MKFDDKKKRNKVLLVLFIGVLMGALDIAIVGPALPAIQKQFGIDERSVAWVFAIYVLFNLVGTPLMAKLSDIFGRRTIYIIDVAIFALGSLVVALSPDFNLLIIGRAIQGFGSSGIFPVASAVIGDTFPEENRGSALGLIGAVFGIAFIIGPALAGVLLMFSWHWLFIVNIPIALLVIFMSLKLLPNEKQKERKSFDLKGMILIGIILTCLSFGFNQIKPDNFIQSIFSINVLPFLIAALILLPFFGKTENSSEDPILRIKLLTSRQVILVCAIAIGAGVTEAAVVFVPPLLVSLYGVTTSKASFMLFPIVLATAFGSPLCGRMLDKMGSKVVLITGTFLLAVGMLGLSYMSYFLVGFYIFSILMGLGMGFLVGAPLRYIMLNESLPSEKAASQGALRLFTGIGQLMGSALVGAIASAGISQASGLENAFMMVGVMSAVLLIASFWLKSRARELETSAGTS